MCLFLSLSRFPDIKIDTLTISREQHDSFQTNASIRLENRMQVIYRDYRDHIGQYSRIYSIEMSKQLACNIGRHILIRLKIY